MGKNSAIKWTDDTFNPWIGCSRVSPGCAHCYAEIENGKKKWNKAGWGPDAPRSLTGTWRNPVKANAEAKKAGVRTKMFVASLADVFDDHPSILQRWRDDLWALIRATPNLDWLVLTKRPENFARFLPPGWGKKGYKNVWLGVTAETGEWANRRLPILAATPAMVRFASVEPLLDDDFFAHLTPEGRAALAAMDQIIVAGESDQVVRKGDTLRGRPLGAKVVREMLAFCREQGIAFFFKQWGTVDQSGQAARNKEPALLDGVGYEEYPVVTGSRKPASPADRQRALRQRRRASQSDPEAAQRRLDLWLCTDAYETLRRMADAEGKPMADVLEAIIRKAAGQQ